MLRLLAFSLEPVFMDDKVDRRDIVGAWALFETDLCTACASFAAESSKSRNIKVIKPPKHTISAVNRKTKSRVPRYATATDGARMLRASAQ
jgi:hypothetical protein